MRRSGRTSPSARFAAIEFFAALRPGARRASRGGFPPATARRERPFRGLRSAGGLARAGRTRLVSNTCTEPAGEGYVHPVTAEEVAERIKRLPKRFLQNLEVVQFSRMTRKRALFPCYGMQWGSAVYLYPIEASLVEIYVGPPRPEQLIEARMFGGKWEQEGRRWRLVWTEEAFAIST